VIPLDERRRTVYFVAGGTMRWIPFVLWLAACTKDEPAESPTVEILAPADGSTVANPVSVSFGVSEFELSETTAQRVVWPVWMAAVEPAEAHGEHPSGQAVLAIDGDEVATVATTQHDLEDLDAGSHTLVISLIDDHGEALEPAVSAEVAFTVEVF